MLKPELLAREKIIELDARLMEGDRIICLKVETLSLLFCFGSKFDGKRTRLAYSFYGQLFMLAHPLDENNTHDLSCIVGVVLLHFESLVRDEQRMFKLQDHNANMPVLSVFNELLSTYLQRGRRRTKRNPMMIATEQAKRFLKNENMYIPSSEWVRALPPKSKRH